jgi:hypothetical protein
MAAYQTFSVSQWPGSPFDSIGKVHVDEEEDQQKCKNAPQDDPDSRQRSALDAAVVERMWHGAAKAFFDKRRAGVKAATFVFIRQGNQRARSAHPEAELSGAGSSDAKKNTNPSDDLPEGIVVAIVLSLVGLAYQVAHPPVYILGRKPGTNVFRPRTKEHPEDEAFPGLLILRPEGRIFFANAEHIADKVRHPADDAKPRVGRLT